jgi:hypothetical protein
MKEVEYLDLMEHPYITLSTSFHNTLSIPGVAEPHEGRAKEH